MKTKIRISLLAIMLLAFQPIFSQVNEDLVELDEVVLTLPFGQTLGKTTGWVHRQSLLKYGVKMIGGVSYQKIDDKGLHYSKDNESEVLEVDNIIICAGQESENELVYSLRGRNINYHVIGGAFMAKELDAKYAIEEGYKLGVVI